MAVCNNKEATRFWSSRQEQRVAKLYDGVQSKNSGAGQFSAGDVKLKKQSVLIECKTATSPKESFSIKKAWIEKAKAEAFSQRFRESVVCFNFGATDHDNYFILDEKQFEDYIRYLTLRAEGEA